MPRGLDTAALVLGSLWIGTTPTSWVHNTSPASDTLNKESVPPTSSALSNLRSKWGQWLTPVASDAPAPSQITSNPSESTLASPMASTGVTTVKTQTAASPITPIALSTPTSIQQGSNNPTQDGTTQEKSPVEKKETGTETANPEMQLPIGTAPLFPDASVIPVCYERFNRENRTISYQENFEGARIENTRPIFPSLQVINSLILGTGCAPGYFYAIGPVFSTPDGRHALSSQYLSDGSLASRVYSRLGNSWEIHGSSQIDCKSDNRTAIELSADRVGNDYTTSVKAQWQGAWILSTAFTQMFTPHFQLGAELKLVPSNGLSFGEVGARFTNRNEVLACALTQSPDLSKLAPRFMNVNGIRASYSKKISDRFSIGTELSCSFADMSSSLNLAWDYTLHFARIQGLIDSGGVVSMLVQDSQGFGASGKIDYWKGDYKFGFAMQLRG